jgi:hypothetical protein
MFNYVIIAFIFAILSASAALFSAICFEALRDV